MNHAETTGTVTSSVTTPSGSKISKFTTKSGFLIPKNKLSGSLVPIIRGGKRGGGDAANEDNNKLGQRKTKWGPDLTQDTAVRKGKALAYQVAGYLLAIVSCFHISVFGSCFRNIIPTSSHLPFLSSFCLLQWCMIIYLCFCICCLK